MPYGGCGEKIPVGDVLLKVRERIHILRHTFSQNKVRGFQGKDLTDEDRIAACVKHFAAYGAVEGGCDYDTVDMSMQSFLRHIIHHMEAAVKRRMCISYDGV